MFTPYSGDWWLYYSRYDAVLTCDDVTSPEVTRGHRGTRSWAALLNSLFIGRKITASRGQSYGKTFNETSPCIGNYERREKYESPLFSLNGHFSSPNLRLEASQQKALTWPIRRQLPRLSTNERTEQLKTRRLLHEAKLDIYKVAESLITFPRYQDEIKST